MMHKRRGINTDENEKGQLTSEVKEINRIWTLCYCIAKLGKRKKL